MFMELQNIDLRLHNVEIAFGYTNLKK